MSHAEVPGELEGAQQRQESPQARSMPSKANRKTISPSRFQTHEGARLSALGCCPQARQIQNRVQPP